MGHPTEHNPELSVRFSGCQLSLLSLDYSQFFQEHLNSCQLNEWYNVIRSLLQVSEV